MMTEPVVAQKKPYNVDVKAGREYHWCACGKSTNQPFCDGSHMGTEFKPHNFNATKDETVHFCGCKNTGNKPVCDGSHNNL